MRVIRRLATTTSSLAALTIAAACSSNSTVAPPGRQPIDMARLLDEFAPPAVAVGPYVTRYVPGLPAMPLGAAAATCPYVAASSRFVCAPVTTNGLTLSLAYTLLDASGHPQSQGDAATTAAIHVVADLVGTNTNGAFVVSTSARQDATLSGLLGATHRVDGTTTARVVESHGLTPSLTVVLAQTVVGLSLPAQASTSTAWPSSGTITSDATETLGTVDTGVTHTEIAFDGTSTAKLTMTIRNGPTQRCTLDLARPAMPPLCAT